MIFGDFEANIALNTPDSGLAAGDLRLPEDDAALTLDGALAAAGLDDRRARPSQEMLAERRDAMVHDLWISPSLLAARRVELAAAEELPLRDLDDAEMALIAGGNYSDMNGDGWGYGGGSDVIVTAPPWDWSFPGNGGGGDTYPSGTGGGSGGQDPHQLTEDADDTPCVDQIPANVDLSHLNDLAKHMGTVLAGLQESTGWEWGAVIYRAANGQLYQSDPFTAQMYDRMDGANFPLPAGAIVVGYIHTHPEDSVMDERNLSDADRTFILNLIESGLADSNMLSYVTTKDESTSYRTYVYDKSKRTATSPGCDL